MTKDWDFKTANTKEYTHCFHNYPAMMIPQIARRLLAHYGDNAGWLFDPYCGTGTSLVEANLRGITAVGTDLNPLARLIAQTKTTPIPLSDLNRYIDDFNNYTFQLQFSTQLPEVDLPTFKNIDYWFAKDIQHKLALIKAYIEQLEANPIQNFFKIAFSETVREASWTRNSEFKLYRMTKKQQATFKPDVFGLMMTKLRRNRAGLQTFMNHQQKQQAHSQVMGFNTVETLPATMVDKFDLVLTSPPYGDSRTTVAYGQFSRLSSQWLDFTEAPQVDKLLMGGQWQPRETCHNGLSALENQLYQISQQDEKRAQEVRIFFDEYAKSIAHVGQAIKPGGYACYVVGNRTVKGVQLPMHKVTQQLFEAHGFKHLTTIQRNIPHKRMPSKNSPTNITGAIGATMAKEHIVVMRK